MSLAQVCKAGAGGILARPPASSACCGHIELLSICHNDTVCLLHIADAGPDAEPLDSIHVPSLLLASASPGNFRGHSERLKEQLKRGTSTEAKKRRVSGSTDAGAGEQYRCTLFPGEPEVVPRATLQHLTKGEVPDDPEQLVWVSTQSALPVRASVLFAATTPSFHAIHTALSVC